MMLPVGRQVLQLNPPQATAAATWMCQDAYLQSTGLTQVWCAVQLLTVRCRGGHTGSSYNVAYSSVLGCGQQWNGSSVTEVGM
jgi:hypothetical protein